MQKMLNRTDREFMVTREIMELMGCDENTLKRRIGLLHTVGALVHFDVEGIRDIVILKPSWITKVHSLFHLLTLIHQLISLITPQSIIQDHCHSDHRYWKESDRINWRISHFFSPQHDLATISRLC